MTPPVVIRRLGLRAYPPTWHEMRDFTAARGHETADELWVVQHYPVFTLGQAGRREHLLAPGEIPVIQVDRGGQVTYHGPGQVVVYPLLDLKRLRLGIRALVTVLEQSVVELLAGYGIAAYARPEAPGVYVEQRKIAALGLRVRRRCSYHGLALNVDMDTEPFRRINPCGYEGLEVTQLRELGVKEEIGVVAEGLLSVLARLLRIDTVSDA